jgi:putative endonuclease
LPQRIWQHKEGLIEGFTKKYDVKRLVWYEQWDLMSDAIGREKRIKEWQRDWKINLIERENPEWMDLYRSIL